MKRKRDGYSLESDGTFQEQPMCQRRGLCFLAVTVSISKQQLKPITREHLCFSLMGLIFSLGTEWVSYSVVEPLFTGSGHQGRVSSRCCHVHFLSLILLATGIPSLQRPWRPREGTNPRSSHKEGAVSNSNPHAPILQPRCPGSHCASDTKELQSQGSGSQRKES